jgi:hypothetical protein
MVLEPEFAHMCWGVTWRYKPRYSNWEGRRCGSTMFSYVFPIACRDLLADCLERDSPRDQLVVTLFLLTVFGLLLGAGVKNRMIKAGLSADIPWNNGRRWWEVSTSPNHDQSLTDRRTSWLVLDAPTTVIRAWSFSLWI